MDSATRSAHSEGVETRRLRTALESSLFGAQPAPIRLGRFEILGRLGEGGMGVVYRARDTLLNRAVAIKALSSGMFMSDAQRGDAKRRLAAEAQALAKLAHPNVVTVLDVGSEDGVLYIAMDLLEGGTLVDWARRNPIGGRARTRRVIELFDQAATGLVAAHDAGLVHRDIKPRNLLLDGDDVLKIADFGLASSSAARSVLDAGTTLEGQGGPGSVSEVVGTPAYMAPEQYEGGASSLSDQFSLCATFWEVVFGVRPFDAKSVPALMIEIMESRPREPPTNARVPPWFREILLRGLQKDPARRFASMHAVRAAIRSGDPGRWRLFGIAAGAVALAAGAAGAATEAPAQCRLPHVRPSAEWSGMRGALWDGEFAGVMSGTEFGALAGQLDAYASDWDAQWMSACETTRANEANGGASDDAAMLCLSRGAARFSALLSLAAEPNPTPLFAQQAAGRVASLAPPALCAPDSGPVNRAAVLPADPQLRRRIVQLDRTLAAAEEQDFAMGPDERQGILDLEAEVEATGYAPLYFFWADIASDVYIGRQDPRGVEVLRTALQLAEDTESYFHAVTLSLMLDEMIRKTGDDAGEGRRYFRNAESLLERIEDPRKRRGQAGELDLARGILATKTGDLDSAVQSIRRAAEVYETLEGNSGRNVARCYQHLGGALLNAGRYDEASDALRHALEIRRRSAGTAIYQLGLRSMLLRVAFETGDADTAILFARECVEQSTLLLGEDELNTIAMRGNLGAAFALAGRDEDAREVFAQMVAGLQNHPERVPLQVTARVNLSESTSDPQEALRIAQQGYDLAVAHDPNVFSRATALAAMARASHELGDADVAVARMDEALGFFESVGRARRVIGAQVILARWLTQTRELTRAKPYLDAALASAEELYGGESSRRAGVDLAQAQWLFANGERENAAAWLKRVQRESKDAPDQDDIREDAAALSEALD